MTPPLTIVSAAIRVGEVILSMPRPASEQRVLARVMDACRFPVYGQPDVPQGFLTSAGTFVDRREALSIARAAGQLDGREKHGSPEELYSEDLW